MKIESIPAAGVVVGRRHRAADPAKVQEIAASIVRIGLLQPITVYTPDDATVELVAGLHRLEAVRSLGWLEIDAVFTTGDAVDREMIEIAENLNRADLTKEQRDKQIRRLAELIEEKERERLQSQQNASIESKRSDRRGHRPEGVATKIAKQTGLSKDTVRRALNPKPPKPRQASVVAVADPSKAREPPGIIAALPRAAAPHPEMVMLDEEREFAALMTAWEAAGPAARLRFKAVIRASSITHAVDGVSVQASSRLLPAADAGPIPLFLRREAARP